MTEHVGQIATAADRASPVAGATIDRPPGGGSWGYDRGPTPAHPAGHTHAGVDLNAPAGTPVTAPEASIVEARGTLPARPPWTGYAPGVLLRGASGRWHLLAHLSGTAAGGRIPDHVLAVAVGQTLRLGDVVGYIGREGHAHWEVRTQPRAAIIPGTRTREEPYTITIDPAQWLAGVEVAYPGPREGAPPLHPARPPHRIRRVEIVMGAALSSSSSRSQSSRAGKPKTARRMHRSSP